MNINLSKALCMEDSFFHLRLFFREIFHYNEKLMILKMNLREQRSEDIFLLQTGLFIKHIVSETIA